MKQLWIKCDQTEHDHSFKTARFATYFHKLTPTTTTTQRKTATKHKENNKKHTKTSNPPKHILGCYIFQRLVSRPLRTQQNIKEHFGMTANSDETALASIWSNQTQQSIYNRIIYTVFWQITANNDDNIRGNTTKMRKTIQKNTKTLRPKKFFIWLLYFETLYFQTLPGFNKTQISY